MEKKLAVVYLFIIMLGFYATTLLFFTGNPFANDTANATVNFQIDNVTGIVPVAILQNAIPVGAGYGCRPCPPATNVTVTGNANAYSDYQNIYGHVGNISVTVKGGGQNFGPMIQKIASAFLFSQAVSKIQPPSIDLKVLPPPVININFPETLAPMNQGIAYGILAILIIEFLVWKRRGIKGVAKRVWKIGRDRLASASKPRVAT